MSTRRAISRIRSSRRDGSAHMINSRTSTFKSMKRAILMYFVLNPELTPVKSSPCFLNMKASRSSRFCGNLMNGHWASGSRMM